MDPNTRKLTSSSSTPDSGCPKNESKPAEVVQNINEKENGKDTNNVKENGKWPPLSFSPAESLDSDVTLVSSSIDPQTNDVVRPQVLQLHVCQENILHKNNRLFLKKYS